MIYVSDSIFRLPIGLTTPKSAARPGVLEIEHGPLVIRIVGSSDRHNYDPSLQSHREYVQ
ncbi:hypothetical protein D8S78_03560 [Natrialba swarupiae]|nr:hypothetical protein [Natrialba swarupiae]